MSRQASRSAGRLCAAAGPGASVTVTAVAAAARSIAIRMVVRIGILMTMRVTIGIATVIAKPLPTGAGQIDGPGGDPRDRMRCSLRMAVKIALKNGGDPPTIRALPPPVYHPADRFCRIRIPTPTPSGRSEEHTSE